MWQLSTENGKNIKQMIICTVIENLDMDLKRVKAIVECDYSTSTKHDHRLDASGWIFHCYCMNHLFVYTLKHIQQYMKGFG